MTVTAAQIKTQIEAGSYPTDTLTSDNIFDYPQYERRRRYPSCEVIINNPPSTVESKRDTQTTYGFEIKLFTKNLGMQSDEITTQSSIETTIMAQIEAMNLQDHKLTLESKTWRREQFQRDANHPSFLQSVLVVQVRQVTKSVLTLDGTLTVLEIDDSAVTNITFDCFDTSIDEGFRHIEEYVTSNPDGVLVGVDYAGGFSGTFVTNIVIKSADIGGTSEKLNNLINLNAQGFPKTIKITYTDKTNLASPATVTETIYINSTSLQRLYRHNDNTVFRLLGHVTKPSSITL